MINPSSKATNKVTTLLIVEDELASMELLYSYFNQQPYEVYKAHNCSQARELLAQKTIDIVLLDITLPDGDGLALTREIRSRSNMGIILVTQRSDDIDRIVGLELGADDYVTKPYNIRELMVRVKNLSSRLHQETLNNTHQLGEQINFDCWSFLPGRRLLIHKDGQEVSLTEGEYKLLAALLANPGLVLSRDQLMNKMQRRDWYPTDRTIDVMVARLRKKLNDDKGSPKYISTVHGAGYLFIAPIESADS
ncbi:response regulator [Pseudoteredinibacter isoporae]|uniref:response regulator n=1 Tax=Pseudoteredinibacter isoporae TaxID=570281 RepID=UPI003109008B